MTDTYSQDGTILDTNSRTQPAVDFDILQLDPAAWARAAAQERDDSGRRGPGMFVRLEDFLVPWFQQAIDRAYTKGANDANCKRMHLNVVGDGPDNYDENWSETTDARAWSTAFLRTVCTDELTIDFDMMVVWFASALERGRGAGYAAGYVVGEKDAFSKTEGVLDTLNERINVLQSRLAIGMPSGEQVRMMRRAAMELDEMQAGLQHMRPKVEAYEALLQVLSLASPRVMGSENRTNLPHQLRQRADEIADAQAMAYAAAAERAMPQRPGHSVSTSGDD